MPESEIYEEFRPRQLAINLGVGALAALAFYVGFQATAEEQRPEPNTTEQVTDDH